MFHASRAATELGTGQAHASPIEAAEPAITASPSASPATRRGDGPILRLDVFKLDDGVYQGTMSDGQQDLFETTAHSLIRGVIREAGSMTGDFYGVEVSYGGVVIGTYRLDTLSASADGIALQAVITVSDLPR